MAKKPIINAHTHIFTADHVPPFLAKTVLPALVYRIFHLGIIVYFFRLWYNGPDKWQYSPWAKTISRWRYQFKVFIYRNYILHILYTLIGFWLFIQVLFLAVSLFKIKLPFPETLKQVESFLVTYKLYLSGAGVGHKVFFTLVLLAFFPSLRNLLFFLLKKLVKVFASIPGKQTIELAKRYLTIGRHAFYKDQERIFRNLRYQYPQGTKFVVLPMDMKYMKAGEVNESYKKQMQRLIDIKSYAAFKDIIEPFVFVDPRRIAEDASFFQYEYVNGEILLKDCMIKTLIETHRFAGFKIYPALGYYVFEPELLALWKYAQQKDLPIMTHCIRGTIYYRGSKKKEWDTHLIFKESSGDNEYKPLMLPEIKNADFCNNFTHPLNYLCLLDETLLIELLEKDAYKGVRSLFGHTPNCKTLTSNLSQLKICLAHFGGEDEWKRYFELDRDNYSTQVLKNPTVGITFLKNQSGKATPGKIEQLWKSCDWYSIICSLMLQYENIYADISYISHDNAIHALLKRTLSKDNPKLRSRVLFGTDFYVVRNHKSDKQIMADTLGGLNEEEFDLIARENPEVFLKRL